MKINEIVIYKLEATNKELNIGTYDKYDSSPYYKINGNWYATNGNRIFPLETYDKLTYDGLSKILEDLFREMHPFKCQLELF